MIHAMGRLSRTIAISPSGSRMANAMGNKPAVRVELIMLASPDTKRYDGSKKRQYKPSRLPTALRT